MRRHPPSPLAVVLLAAGVLALVRPLAAAAAWTSHGPEGGDMTALAAAPSAPGTVYAGTSLKGVFKSTNAGATWAPVNAGLGNLAVYGLAVHPTAATTVYAATNGGVFKTTDGGASWTAMNTGLTALRVTAIALDPKTPDILYAGMAAGGGGGVHRSTNGGASWIPANASGSSDPLDLTETVRAVAVDPLVTVRIYAATFGRGIFKSPNSGLETWPKVSNGLGNFTVTSLAVHPRAANVIYAGTLGSGVYVSANGGGQWARVSNELDHNRVTALAIDPQAPENGLTMIYAGTLGGGVYRTVNSGNEWVQIAGGLVGHDVTALAFDAAVPGVVYAGTPGAGVFTQAVTDSAWTPASTGLPGAKVVALAVDPAAPASVLAGTVGGGIYGSDDAGMTWTPQGTGLPFFRVDTLVFDTANPGTVYAGAGEVLVSKDGGVTWSVRSSGVRGVTSIALDPSDGQTIYAGTIATGIFRSLDAGVSWQAIGADVGRRQIFALAVDPAAPATVYAGTDTGGVYKSTDGGDSWSPAGLDDFTIVTLLVGPGGTLHAATRNHGVFRSANGGTSWIPASAGLPTGDVLALARDPANPGTLYAGTPFDGVFASTDGGASWSPTSDGLTSLDVGALAFAPGAGGTAYAGARGVFARTDDVPACAGDADCGPCERCDLGLDACVVAEPFPACRPSLVAGKSQLTVKRGRRARSNALAFAWQKGAATDAADFGDPVATDDYALCVFDVSGSLLFAAAAPAGGTCGRRDCWRGRGRPRGARGYKYSDRDATPDGLKTIDLKPGADTKARLTVKGRGEALDLPALPMPLPLLVQLQAGNGQCWEATFGAGGIRRNDEKQLRAKALP